jgi:hypothetical protein
MFTDSNSQPLKSRTLEKKMPQQESKEAIAALVAFAETTEGATKNVGMAMLATSLVSSSAAILISFIGFSETLAFLPMVNIPYTVGLTYFFQGISGLNF